MGSRAGTKLWQFKMFVFFWKIFILLFEYLHVSIIGLGAISTFALFLLPMAIDLIEFAILSYFY
jgi:hypothetical protein